MQRINTLPDENLAAEVLPPLLAVVSALAAMSIGILLIVQWHASASPYLLSLALIGCVCVSGFLLQRGRLRPAGIITSYTLALLPILSIIPFGVANNTLIFLSVTGVIAAGVLISPDAPLVVACYAIGELMIEIDEPAARRLAARDREGASETHRSHERGVRGDRSVELPAGRDFDSVLQEKASPGAHAVRPARAVLG